MSSSILLGTGSITSTATATVKEDGTFDTDSRNSILGAAVATTATAVAGQSLNAYGTKQVYQKYAQAYVESMSDEELERALAQMDLIIGEEVDNSNIKTL